MRKIILVLLMTLIVGCKSEQNTDNQQTDSQSQQNTDNQQTDSQSQQNTDNREVDLNEYLVKNLDSNQIYVVNGLHNSQLGDIMTNNLHTVLLVENNRLLKNLVGVLDTSDSLRIMRLAAESHGYIIAKKE